jgi:hypothetical protein
MLSRAVATFSVCLAFLAEGAGAGVFKCEVDGKTVFSDRPCGTDAEEVDIQYRQPNASEAAEIERRTDQYFKDLARRKHDGQVYAQKRRIKALERARDERLAQLRWRKQFTNNNLAGATLEQSISTEMSAVAEQFGQKIDAATRELERMQAQQP